MSVYLHNKPLSTCPRGHKRNENLEISVCFQYKPLSTCPQGHKTDIYDIFVYYGINPMLFYSRSLNRE